MSLTTEYRESNLADARHPKRSFASIVWGDTQEEIGQAPTTPRKQLRRASSANDPGVIARRPKFSDVFAELLDTSEHNTNFGSVKLQSVGVVADLAETVAVSNAFARIDGETDALACEETESECFSTELDTDPDEAGSACAAIDSDSEFDTDSDDNALVSSSTSSRISDDASLETSTRCASPRAATEGAFVDTCATTFDDSLVNAWLETPKNVETDAASESSFDSELTDNENCNEGPHEDPHMSEHPSKCHWSEDDQFWDSVERKLSRCFSEPWFSNVYFYTSPEKFQENLGESTYFIANQVDGRCDEFKIGITEDPWDRWWRTDCGYHLPQQNFHTMYLLYAAPTSKHKIEKFDSAETKALKSESTGAMEISLISRFAGQAVHSICLNREGAGGECPSNGSPHFVYVVVRDRE